MYIQGLDRTIKRFLIIAFSWKNSKFEQFQSKNVNLYFRFKDLCYQTLQIIGIKQFLKCSDIVLCIARWVRTHFNTRNERPSGSKTDATVCIHVVHGPFSSGAQWRKKTTKDQYCQLEGEQLFLLNAGHKIHHIVANLCLIDCTFKNSFLSYF